RRSLGRRHRGSGDVAEASGDVPEAHFLIGIFLNFSSDVASGATSPVDILDVAKGDGAASNGSRRRSGKRR
ncbi:unnamed protein product, partial [Musa textilis]